MIPEDTRFPRIARFESQASSMRLAGDPPALLACSEVRYVPGRRALPSDRLLQPLERALVVSFTPRPFPIDRRPALRPTEHAVGTLGTNRSRGLAK